MGRSPIRFSASLGDGGAFLHTAAAREIPSDAVVVTEHRHHQLLDAQASGKRIVADTQGRPQIVDPPPPTIDQLVVVIKREARRRILAVATIERQTNDNALLALASASIPGLATPAATDITAAVARRQRIDAIRAASNRAESVVMRLSRSGRASFDPRADHLWPKD